MGEGRITGGTTLVQDLPLALVPTLGWSVPLSGPPLIGKIVRSVRPASQGSHRVPGSRGHSRMWETLQF